MNETITDRYRIFFKHLNYFNKLIENISLSNNTFEDKAIAINRVKNITKQVLSHLNDK